VSGKNPPQVIHSPATKITRVTFEDGRVIEIPGITAKDHAKLLQAPCVGSAIAAMMMHRGGKIVTG
jgi:hypothetical protein